MRLEAHRHQGLGQFCLEDCSPTSDEILYSSEMAQPLGPGGSFIFPQGLWELRAHGSNTLAEGDRGVSNASRS